MHKCALFLFLFLAACAPPITPTSTPRPSFAPPSTTTPAATATPASPSSTPTLVSIQTPAWFRDVVLFEIFPRSFRDSNGDGIGDLRGITAQLDYLQKLGIGAIWLTPIFASPSYHGYDTTDYYAIHPDFGTEADLVELVREAHRRNIRILLDYVVAHTSNQHPFFKDAYGNPASRYSGWYRWTNAEHTTYESFSGVKEMPTLNHDNPEVQKYLLDVAKYWLKTGIDGYRADYVLNVPHPFWKQWRAELKAINPDLLLLAEAWTNARDIKPYYDGEFDAAFDFPLYGDIEGNQDRVGDSFLLGTLSPHLMDGTLKAEQVLFPPGAERVEFLNNHDTNRVMSEVKGDRRRAKLAAMLLLTLPNTPMVYYGEEIGMAGTKAPAPDYDKTRREPMDWYAAEAGPGMTTWYKPPDRNNKPNDGISVEEEQGKPDSLLESYRTLVALRNANAALRRGVWTQVPTGNDKRYAYLRSDSESAFLTILNFEDRSVPATLDLSSVSLPFRPAAVHSLLSGRNESISGGRLEITLEPLAGELVQLAP